MVRTISALDKVEVVGDEEIGISILKRALEEPIRQIAINAGKEGSVVADAVKKADGNEGYNAADDKMEDLVAAGIVDPTKVTRSALQNAASAASMLLTTEAVVTDLPAKEGEGGGAPAMPGGMPGMGGMPMM